MAISQRRPFVRYLFIFCNFYGVRTDGHYARKPRNNRIFDRPGVSERAERLADGNGFDREYQRLLD